MKRSLLIGASLAAFAAGSVSAQTGAPDAAGTPPVPNEPASAGAVDAPQAPTVNGLADIIVTATKVETTLQKTPQAIQTIDGATLARAGVSSAQQLSKLVGGLQIEQNGSGASIFIRGVGSRVLSPSSDPAVAFSVDGVFYARPVGTSASLFDISRIEVVKGPQGTLYGRNATGGAVNVVSNHPTLGQRSLQGEVEVGNYSSVRAIAAVNLPIGDNAAFRIAGQTVYHNGYLSDGYSDDDTKSARASLLFKPHDGLSLYLSADYAHQGGMGPGTVPVGPGPNAALTTRFVVPGAPYTGPSDPRINGFFQSSAPRDSIPLPIPGVYCPGLPLNGASGAAIVNAPALPLCAHPIGVNPILADGFLDNDFYGANITADADVGIGRLTAIGGYRGTKLDTRFSVDPSPQLNKNRINQFSGEVRLASKPGDGKLKWLIGGFYLHEKQVTSTVNSTNNSAVGGTCIGALDPDGPGPAAPIPGLCLASVTVQSTFGVVDPGIINETYAGFGQATYSFTPWLRLTGGVRYTHEHKAEENGVITTTYAVPAGTSSSYPSEGSVKYNNVSYRAGAEIDVAPRSMLYATYSTAFHAGGFNLGIRQGPNTYEYKPEKVASYVVGIKNRFLDNRLQINVEGFWLNYNNYQQNNFGRVNDGSIPCSQLGIVPACPFTLRTENAAKARVRGIEGDIVFAPIRDTTINVDILYNDAKFRRFDLANPFDPSAPPTSYAGNRIPGSYPLTITGGINQAFPLANGGRLIADARTQYKKGTYLWFVHVPGDYQKSNTRTDLSLTYEAPEGRFSITGYVRNVENKATLLQGAPIDNTSGVVWTNLNPPRTFGGIFGFKF